MNLPSMGTGLVSRELLRIAGGYGAPAEGDSPAGGLDIDQAGHLATDGDVTVDGEVSVGTNLTVGNQIIAGSGSETLTDVAGKLKMSAWEQNGATSSQVPQWNGSAWVPVSMIEAYVLACSDEDTDLTVGTAKTTFRMPYAFVVTGVRASVNTAPTGSALTVDINLSGTSMLSTKLTIDVGEKTSVTAATPAVVSDTTIDDDEVVSVDVDVIGSTVAGAGLKVALIGYKGA